MTADTAPLDGVLAETAAGRTNEQCPVARALDLVGTRSALLIIREAYYGTRRFQDFVDRVEITEPVAAARLRELTEAGLLERRPYREPGQRTRSEYRLTQMGRDLAPAIIALFQWGAEYLSPGGKAPLDLRHVDCGAPVHVVMRCDDGHDVRLNRLRVKPTSP